MLDLENAITRLYESGKGYLDPASLIVGDTNFGKRDEEYGYVSHPEYKAQPLKWQQCAPVSSGPRRSVTDLVIDVVQNLEKEGHSV